MKIQYQDHQLTIFESALYRTTTTLIKAKDYLLLIDPNWLPVEIQFIQEVVEREGANKEKYLLFTHSDYDHIIGYEAFPNFTTIASKAFVEKEDKEQVLDEIRKFDEEYYIERDYPITYPSIDIAIHQANRDLNLHGDHYLFYEAAGHNKDGLITFNQSKGIVVAGDYLSNIEFPFIYDSLSNYKTTLQTFQQILDTEQVAILVTGHGDATTDLREMKARIKDSFQYLQALTQSILTDEPFNLPALLSNYSFPKGLVKCHEANVVVARKELMGMNK